MASQSTEGLKFQSFQSVTDVSFWHDFSQRKLNDYKLSEEPLTVYASYSPSRSPKIPSRITLRGGALDSHEEATRSFAPFECEAVGKLVNRNTIEAFKTTDKKKLLADAVDALDVQIKSGQAEANPSLLCSFTILSFADLKKHKFYHWFAFPAIAPKVPFRLSQSPCEASRGMSTGELLGSLQGLLKLRSAPHLAHCGFFLGIAGQNQDEPAEVLPLEGWAATTASQRDRAFLIFVDPCSLDSHPGWPLRNFLYLAFFQWKMAHAKVLCFRETLGSGTRAMIDALAASGDSQKVRGMFSASLLLHVELPEDGLEAGISPVSGWEPNSQGKMGPKLSDLSAQMDPVKLAESACDLNLRLMRWRTLPELDTAVLASTKCLLLGSGTLGCGVGRSLLGWGFRHVTLLDNGKVSHSNPVRQSLFNFEDCGKPKAEAAAQALKRVFPGVVASGVQLNIPMPGHLVASEGATALALTEAERLEELIVSHDVVFLLTDTRESRWLPTLLGAKHKKIVLNAALGFDSFLVMRHGSSGSDEKERLGCYFCNDVVAPQNSMKDRTLDQQCTVTRPGLAPMAAALLVEMLVGILHHPSLDGAPAANKDGTSPEGENSKLGCIPHQVRGFLPSFSTMLVSGPAFPQCTACSKSIVEQYNSDLLVQVFNTPSILEEITGLKALQDSMNQDGTDFDLDGWSDEED